MVSETMKLVRALLRPLAAALLVTLSQAAVPGAWEKFPTLGNADAWRVIDYADGGSYFPEWDSSVPGGEFIWLFHDGDAALEFSADSSVANGALVGNYAAANVDAISCEIFIEDLEEFDLVDASVLTTGADGVERWYYSEPFFDFDFSENGWWEVRFGMGEIWSYLDENTYVPVIPGPAFLSAIKEVSIRFFPVLGSTADSEAAIDNFILEPKVTAPELTTSQTSNSFSIAFTPAPGLAANLQRMTTAAPFTWSDVANQTSIFGPAQHVFTTPLDAPVKIYRVQVSPVYVPIVTGP